MPRRRVQQPGPEPAEVEAAEVVDYYGLEGHVHLVKLQDPSLATERKIHYHTPGQLGPLRRWYIVRYGRQVGVFNNWYVLRFHQKWRD